MKKTIFFLTAIIALTIACASALPGIFLPKRWLDIKPGHERGAVHAVLGVPDYVFTDKQFEGWHNPFGIGASVLIIRYDAMNQVVRESEIKTHWGFNYRAWSQAYKEKLRLLPALRLDATGTPGSLLLPNS